MLLGRARALALVLAAPLALAHSPGAHAAPATYEAIRAARPDGQKIAVADLTLTRDAFSFQITYGQFHLLAPVEGRVFGAVFQGLGRWELTPATEVERRYLGVRRGSPGLKTLSDGFERMLVFWNDETLDEILARGHREEGRPDPDAVSIYENYLVQQRKRWKRNIHLRIYRAFLQRGTPFYAFLDGNSLPPAVLVVDPTGFLDKEETALEVFHAEQGGILYSSHRREEIAPDGSIHCPRQDKLDVLHYAIDTRVKGTSLEAAATIRFKTLASGTRFLPLGLLPSLRIREASWAVASGESAREVPLEFVQGDKDEDAEAALVFPEPLRVGEDATIRVQYAGGDVLEDDGDGNFQVNARTSWYPNLGLRDRATFDLTFHVPAAKQVVSVGRLVSSADEPEGTVSVWKTESPIQVAGFNYGTFRVLEETEKNTGVKLQVYTNPGTPNAIAELNLALSRDPTGSSGVRFDTETLAQNVLADSSNALQVYSAVFGPLGRDRISITQQSALDFGQSWPGLLFIPYMGALSSTTRAQLGLTGGSTFIDQVAMHEMAHQWWGHRVGWRSYRDQWLSEGFAEFSVALALQTTRGSAAHDKFWEDARRRIVEKARGASMRNFEAGPMTLGFRLSTARSPEAYEALAYSKGAYVLHMLRMAMRNDKSQNPDERFFALMRDFLRAHDGGSATTEDFKAAVDKHMVPALDATHTGKANWFFDQWVYGTEIPRYTLKADIEEAADDKWRIRGSVAQEEVSPGFLAMVPLYLEFDEGRFRLLAKVPFKGNQSQPLDVTLALSEKPKRVRLNLQHEVLALDEP